MPQIANFWRVGVLDVVLSEYLNKSHNFTNFIFYDITLRYSITCGVNQTRAQCNVIPLNLYKKATKDYRLERVTPLNTQLAAYGGSKLSVVGQVRITVWRDDLKCKLDCKLVDSNTIRPLLGRKACVGMKIIKYTDNDELNKPQTGSAPVYSLERTTMEKVTHVPITREALIEKYPDVFGDGVGKLAGEHHIRLDNTVDPV